MRIDYTREFPAARQAMLGLERAVHSSSLEPLLLELVKIRASQLNGCAHCLEMHTKDARALGEDDDRMHLVAAWREAPCFTARGRAALQWCETLTLLPQTGVSTPSENRPPIAGWVPGWFRVIVATLTLFIVSGRG